MLYLHFYLQHWTPDFYLQCRLAPLLHSSMWKRPGCEPAQTKIYQKKGKINKKKEKHVDLVLF